MTDFGGDQDTSSESAGGSEDGEGEQERDAESDGTDETLEASSDELDSDPGGATPDEEAEPSRDQDIQSGAGEGQEGDTGDQEEGGGDGDAGLEDVDLDLNPLETDQQQAEQEADEVGVDYNGLDRELKRLADEQDEQEGEEQDDQSGGSGEQSEGTGDGAGEGELNGLSVLPDPQDGHKTDLPPGEWDDVCREADSVAHTLEKSLRLDRQEASRTGQTSGSLDTSKAYRLSMGDTRAFGLEIPGEEKEYALVIVLDRSISMRHGNPSKCSVATDAVARFALAAEDLGIEVAIIDFIYDEARLVKPFSVDTEVTRGTILANDRGGSTPLSDALELAVELVEDRADEPLIVSITDDKPGDADAVKRVVRESWTPICSLTIATDCKPGNPPDKAKELEPVYERTETVFEERELDRTLDRFASLMAGL